MSGGVVSAALSVALRPDSTPVVSAEGWYEVLICSAIVEVATVETRLPAAQFRGRLLASLSNRLRRYRD